MFWNTIKKAVSFGLAILLIGLWLLTSAAVSIQIVKLFNVDQKSDTELWLSFTAFLLTFIILGSLPTYVGNVIYWLINWRNNRKLQALMRIEQSQCTLKNLTEYKTKCTEMFKRSSYKNKPLIKRVTFPRRYSRAIINGLGININEALHVTVEDDIDIGNKYNPALYQAAEQKEWRDCKINDVTCSLRYAVDDTHITISFKDEVDPSVAISILDESIEWLKASK